MSAAPSTSIERGGQASRTRNGLSALLICCAFAGAAHGEELLGVTAVRFWSLGDVTRVAIETTDEFQYRSDRLANPDRLFFDIVGAKPRFGGKGMHVISVGDSLVRQIRVAETQPGTTRVVLDLQEGADEFVASQLSNPNRLMVEIRAKGRTSPSVAPSVLGAKKLTEESARPLSPDLLIPVTKPQPQPAPRLEQPKLTNSKPDLRAAAPPAETSSLTKLPKAPPPVEGPTPGRPRESSTVVADVKPTSTPIMQPGGRSTPPVPNVTPEPAKRNSNGDRSLTRVLGLKLGRIVIDPGHGGHDNGTHGPSGLQEKDLVLDVSKRLAKLLEERLGSEVILTRSDDTFIPLEERTQIANDKKADLFLSVHANSSQIRTADGVETYYLSFTTSKTALDVAARENASSQRSIYDLQELLQKIALKDKVDESREFASRVQTALTALSVKSGTKIRDRGVRKAPFVVLIGASMPSVLAEIGFLSNAADETLMRKPEQRQKIAEALYKGVASYAGTLSHFQVAEAKTGN